MTDYFLGCTNQIDRKAKFRELAKIHHPDVTGDSTIMTEVIRQYKQKQKQANGYDTYKRSNSYSPWNTEFNQHAFNEAMRQATQNFAKQNPFGTKSRTSYKQPMDEEVKKKYSNIKIELEIRINHLEQIVKQKQNEIKMLKMKATKQRELTERLAVHVATYNSKSIFEKLLFGFINGKLGTN